MDRLRQFWQRVSEGRQIDDLWSQFAADARSSYGLAATLTGRRSTGFRAGGSRFT